MIKHSKLGSCKPITMTVQWQINLKQNSNPNIGGGYWLYSLRAIQGPLLTSLRSLDTLQGPNGPKDSDAAPWQILDVNLFQWFLLTPMEFGPQTKAIGYLMKLSFHLYVDHWKRSSDVSWASILLQTGPGARDGLELNLDWASNLAWTPLIDS
jgi:hypothetical protein